TAIGFLRSPRRSPRPICSCPFWRYSGRRGSSRRHSRERRPPPRPCLPPVLRRVFPVQPAQPKEIPERRQSIPNDRHFRLRRVDPNDGDFGDLEPAAPGEVEDLHVVGEAVDAGPPEELAGNVAAEQLEAALRVVDS